MQRGKRSKLLNPHHPQTHPVPHVCSFFFFSFFSRSAPSTVIVCSMHYINVFASIEYSTKVYRHIQGQIRSRQQPHSSFEVKVLNVKTQFRPLGDCYWTLMTHYSMWDGAESPLLKTSTTELQKNNNNSLGVYLLSKSDLLSWWPLLVQTNWWQCGRVSKANHMKHNKIRLSSKKDSGNFISCGHLWCIHLHLKEQFNPNQKYRFFSPSYL